MNLVADMLSRKLALAGTTAALAWIIGLYFALLPAVLPGLPAFITAGSFEWVFAFLALASGVWCSGLLYQAFRCRGVVWWAYAIGILTVGGTALVAIIVLYGLIHSHH